MYFYKENLYYNEIVNVRKISNPGGAYREKSSCRR